MTEQEKARLEEIRFKLGRLYGRLGQFEHQRTLLIKDSSLLGAEIEDLNAEAVLLQAKEEKKENE